MIDISNIGVLMFQPNDRYQIVPGKDLHVRRNNVVLKRKPLCGWREKW